MTLPKNIFPKDVLQRLTKIRQRQLILGQQTLHISGNDCLRNLATVNIQNNREISDDVLQQHDGKYQMLKELRLRWHRSSAGTGRKSGIVQVLEQLWEPALRRVVVLETVGKRLVLQLIWQTLSQCLTGATMFTQHTPFQKLLQNQHYIWYNRVVSKWVRYVPITH